MAYYTRSDYEKAQVRQLAKENLIWHIIEAYRAQPEGSRSHQKGYRTLTAQIMDDYKAETGTRVNINWATVRKRYEGTRSLLQPQADDALLTPEEDSIPTR